MHDKQRTKDRRAEKTEALLREALGALIREKSYDDIVVKEILARADVGRSTFYAHFHDKDELLLSGIQDMLRSAQSREGIVWFSLPILEHIEEHRGRPQERVAPLPQQGGSWFTGADGPLDCHDLRARFELVGGE